MLSATRESRELSAIKIDHFILKFLRRKKIKELLSSGCPSDSNALLTSLCIMHVRRLEYMHKVYEIEVPGRPYIDWCVNVVLTIGVLSGSPLISRFTKSDR